MPVPQLINAGRDAVDLCTALTAQFCRMDVTSATPRRHARSANLDLASTSGPSLTSQAPGAHRQRLFRHHAAHDTSRQLENGLSLPCNRRFFIFLKFLDLLATAPRAS